MIENYLKNSELGKNSEYSNSYNPNLLFAIPRKIKRDELSKTPISFYGVDIWNAYEISWLNSKGRPEVRIGELIYDANSPYMVESKSLKLYLNSFNNTKIKDGDALINTISSDLEKILQTKVKFSLFEVESKHFQPTQSQGTCLDTLDIDFNNDATHNPTLNLNNKIVTEKLYTHLLRSNCLITNQPDFGTLYIQYNGIAIDHSSLLSYIISLRQHNEFHEQCVERIFVEILKCCKPDDLLVYARYTRRGGIDINPIRSLNSNFDIYNQRSMRQ